MLSYEQYYCYNGVRKLLKLNVYEDNINILLLEN